MVSILMLTHNAYDYTKNTIETLQMTKGDYELIVVDNDSNKKVKKLLLNLFNQGKIDKLHFSNKNTLFAKGNNIAFRLSDVRADKVLLLNSDIDIRNQYWLEEMLKHYKKGIFTLGISETDPYTRVDGYCFMIDKKLYDKYLLDENYEWWWSITKLQAQVLNDGYTVAGVRDTTNLLFHYGGMSGEDFRNSKGMDIDGKKVIKWFNNNKIKIINKIRNDNTVYNKNSKANRKYQAHLKKKK
jgi:hypothetical protein